MEAEKLLKDLDLYYIPIRIIELAQKLGFTILQQDTNNKDYVSAILVNKHEFTIDNNKLNKAIIIDCNLDYAVKRLLIAYELSHYLLCEDKDKDKCYAHLVRSLKEIHKSKQFSFACNLLCPKSMVNNIIYTNDLDILHPRVHQILSNKFYVSYKVIYNQLSILE